MVNMPINVSTFPTDELGLVTDINQNINQEYYEWLLKQHNYFPDCAFHKEKFEDTIKMEHSYTRDWKPTSNCEIMTTRTILIERPPECPSCHQLPPNHDEKVDTPETYNIPIPPYNEEAGRRALNATEEMIKSCHNRNSDSDDWTESIHKFNWTDQQLDLFERVERILDMDQLGRLAVTGLTNECLRRNAIVEKSVARMRAALASVHWEPRLTSWLHGLLVTHLPSKYMVSYIDILQALKRKIPALVDKMLYHKPIEMHKDYLNAITKRPWEPAMVTKTRTLPSNPVIVLISSAVSSVSGCSRLKSWTELLSTLTSVESVTLSSQAIDHRRPLELITEQLVAMTRAKIQEIRNHSPNRHIILAGFNAAAAIALQVALVEPVNSIVCLGFAFNTLFGVRGNPDDRILELTIPVLFVIGQSAQRSSQEEIESLRERMSAQTLLVVVGSSDDALRVKRLNRSMEGVSQSMIDNMIMDEIQEFATNCIMNPPGPRKVKQLNGVRKATKQRGSPLENDFVPKRKRLNGYKKNFGLVKDDVSTKRLSIQNGFELRYDDVLPPKMMQNGSPQKLLNGSSNIRQKVKFIPANRFVHIKPPPINTQKIYVKQQNGNHSYTLGVKSISTSDISLMKNTVARNGEVEDPIEVRISENSAEDEVLDVSETAPKVNDINIFDIPILFVDNDGNMLGEQCDNQMPMLTAEEVELDEKSEPESHREIQNGTEQAPKPEQEPDVELEPEQSLEDEHDANVRGAKKIEILSQEIINGPIFGVNGTSVVPPKPSSRPSKFVVLNKNTLSRIRTGQGFPAGKLKRIVFPSRETTMENRVPSVNVAKIGMNGHHLRSPIQVNRREDEYSNGRSRSPESGILIKRNHMKNITVRKMNIVQSIRSEGAEESDEKSTSDSKKDSLKHLIEGVEN